VEAESDDEMTDAEHDKNTKKVSNNKSKSKRPISATVKSTGSRSANKLSVSASRKIDKNKTEKVNNTRSNTKPQRSKLQRSKSMPDLHKSAKESIVKTKSKSETVKSKSKSKKDEIKPQFLKKFTLKPHKNMINPLPDQSTIELIDYINKPITELEIVEKDILFNNRNVFKAFKQNDIP
jgi:hypothetical protein